MDSLQEQVFILNDKVDALHQVIENLCERISDSLTEFRSSPETDPYRIQPGVKGGRSYSQLGLRNPNLSMEHKDILLDSDYPDTDGQSGERSLTPEVQIQRLTAQLTAAYNRIAALEEQLLAQRIH